jgi:radical SAM protein with 4Fe4S-binding SPASM domain
LKNNSKFCVLPWIHAHVLPNGDVLPCCAVEVGSMSLGSVNQNSLSEIWNQESFREMRKKMLANETVDACKVCYAAEAAGGTSLRTKSNHDFAHHLELAKETMPDGSLKDFKLRYYDVRFSNLCNLKCRMCCPELSSSVAIDVAKMLGTERPKVLNIYGDREAFLKDFSPHVPYLEEIYFAGGEPLLIDAHYWAIEELINQGKTNIRLRYNTNFTVLGKGKWFAPDLWRHFPHLEIGASLDADFERGEYIREGTIWSKILINREIIRNQVAHADFRVAVTVGAMNLLHVPEFLKICILEGFTRPDGFFTNNLLFPDYFSSQILPEEWKQKARKEYASLIEYMKEEGSPEWILKNLHSITSNMDANDRQDLLPAFFRETTRLDTFYNKKFMNIFPEYRGVENYLKVK